MIVFVESLINVILEILNKHVTAKTNVSVLTFIQEQSHVNFLQHVKKEEYFEKKSQAARTYVFVTHDRMFYENARAVLSNLGIGQGFQTMQGVTQMVIHV